MDYRELLKKYIDHVGECEGVYFIPWDSFGHFTEDDVKVLHELLREVDIAAHDRMQEQIAVRNNRRSQTPS